MREILLVGNPNVGKTTLFNSLTKSSDHTGNFHGVTVEEKAKVVKLNNEEYKIVDLPGLYSLNCYSPEEEVSKRQILKGTGQVLVIVDANSLRRNLYLCMQLSELNINYKILINNYDYFKKRGGEIDTKKLSKMLEVDVKIINAKKVKLGEILFSSIDFKTSNNSLVNLMSESNSNYEEIITNRYTKIDEIISSCVKNSNQIYGHFKLDKFILNPFVSALLFFGFFFFSIYLIFFLIGPFVSEKLSMLINFIFSPIINLMYHLTDNIWLLEFFSSGVLSAFTTVICFLPQVCLLFVFLSLLEDSGLISRFAFSFDDFLSKFGLNGKAIYILLLGFGCNTMSCVACRTMSDKNMRIKTAIINPNISCMARLPVFTLVALAFFSSFSYLMIVGLYLIGIIVSLIMCLILNKTILPTKKSQFILEFPPIRRIDFLHSIKVTIQNAKDFFKRVFGVVFSVGIIVWILTHTQFNLKFTQDINSSILFIIASKLSFLLSPIGLNNAGIFCSLIVGVLAKELIVSTISITNGVTNLSALSASLVLSSSPINFTLPSAVSFLIFALLYCPCISNLAVIKKEVGSFFALLSAIMQLTIAYILSFIVYLSLTKGILFSLIAFIVIVLILSSVIFSIKKIGAKTPTCKKC